MSEGRVYVDFMKMDDEGRVILTCFGTWRDLEALGIRLADGLVLPVYSDDGDSEGNRDDLVTDGIVRFDAANDRWVLEIQRDEIRHESDG